MNAGEIPRSAFRHHLETQWSVLRLLTRPGSWVHMAPDLRDDVGETWGGRWDPSPYATGRMYRVSTRRGLLPSSATSSTVASISLARSASGCSTPPACSQGVCKRWALGSASSMTARSVWVSPSMVFPAPPSIVPSPLHPLHVFRSAGEG